MLRSPSPPDQRCCAYGARGGDSNNNHVINEGVNRTDHDSQHITDHSQESGFDQDRKDITDDNFSEENDQDKPNEPRKQQNTDNVTESVKSDQDNNKKVR
jgi:hypothetical protein